MHFIIGKASFSEVQLLENFNTALEEVNRLKPSSSKGRYIQKASLSSTFGPAVPLDVSLV
jgi:large subunit ribosomal protein L1